ncbi:MAG: hypothetical protein PF447_09115 [Spirochaetaceae bacterium]|jgi:cytoskeletal protein CcmA (bactofilin family)|nr:hypothetical protein [Spirochaetaceae bacterium]
MTFIEQRLEELVKQGRITMGQAFNFSKELPRCSAEKRDEILSGLENGSIDADQAQRMFKQRTATGDQAFQEFSRKLKDIGKEVGSEIENLVADFDKDKFKSNLQGLFDDLSKSFNQAKAPSSRTVNGNYKEGNLHVLDQLLIKGDGEFDQLDVQGSLTIEGQAKMNKLTGIGMVRIKGNLICKLLDFQGEIYVEGNIQAGTVFNSGRLHCKGDYSGVDLSNSGTLNCQGDMQLLKLENSGSLSVDRSIRSDSVHSSGLLNCLGILNAPLVDLKEGRVVFLEADQVHLGSGCRVEDLAYRLECKKDEGAKVKREKKIN